jgi:hypothetical protein
MTMGWYVLASSILLIIIPALFSAMLFNPTAGVAAGALLAVYIMLMIKTITMIIRQIVVRTIISGTQYGRGIPHDMQKGSGSIDNGWNKNLYTKRDWGNITEWKKWEPGTIKQYLSNGAPNPRYSFTKMNGDAATPEESGKAWNRATGLTWPVMPRF